MAALVAGRYGRSPAEAAVADGGASLMVSMSGPYF